MVVMALALAACRDNPGFVVRGETRGSGELESDSSDSGGSSADDTTDESVCTPRVVEDIDFTGLCSDFAGSPIVPFNLATSALLQSRDCEAEVDVLVKRVGDTLYETDDCETISDMESSMGIATALGLPGIGPLLPEDGACARFWHLGRFDPADDACSSAAYGFWDRDGSLRLAATATPEPGPFPGFDGFDLSVTATRNDPCTSPGATTCPNGDIVSETVEFRFGGCTLEALQGETWTDIVVGGTEYTLDLYRAYACLGKPTEFGWFLRRS